MSQGVEIAAAYVTVIPSFKGFNKAMQKEVAAALGGSAISSEAAKMGAKVGASVGRETQKSLASAGGSLYKSISAPLGKAGSVLASSVAKASGSISRTLGGAMKTAVNSALATAGAGAAAVAGQVAVGGFKRAVSMNNAEAKLKALGYQGKQFEMIMASATESVDGTAYTMADAVGSSAQMLAAGIKPGKELTGILKNVGKVSDMSGRSFNEMGTMLSKMASAGTIYAEDLNQLAESGIPIYAEMAKVMGVSAVEVKKLASEGKIAFSDLNKTISAVKWDSELFASTDITSSFNNLRSSLSKIGQKFWDPIISGAVPVINTMKTVVNTITKTVDFTPIEGKIKTMMGKIADLFKPLQDASGKIDPKKVEAKFNEIVDKFESFMEKIKGFEAPLVGLFAGIFGKMMSSVPLLGPLFAGLGPGVGILIGAFVGAAKASESLQSALSGVDEFVQRVGKKLMTAFTGDENFGLKEIGDKLAVALSGVMKFIEDFVGKVAERAPEIKEAFGGVFKAVAEFFSNEGTIGSGLGSGAGNIFSDILIGLGAVIQGIIDVSKKITEIIDVASHSPFVQGVLTTLGGLFNWITQNEGVMTAALGIIAAVFVGGKLIAGIQSIAAVATALTSIGGFLGIGGAAAGVAGGAAAGGGMLAAVIGGLNAAAKKIDLKLIAKVSAAIGMIVATIGGLGLLAKMMHEQGATDGIIAFGGMLTAVADVIQTFVSRWELIGAALVVVAAALAGPLLETLSIGIAKVVAIGTAFGVAIAAVAAIFGGIGKLFKEWDLMSGWQYLADAINMGVDLVLGVIDKMAGIFMEHFGRFMSIVSDFMTRAALVISIMVPQITGFLITLKTIGVEAGAGALAAAEGIGELGLALGKLAGGNFVKNLGDAANSFAGGFGLTDGLTTVDMLREIVQIMGESSAKIVEMSGQWEAALNGAFDFGSKVPVRMVEGLAANENVLHNKVDSMVNHFMTEAQNRLNRQPLEIKVRVDDSAVRRYRAQSMSYGGGSSYNRTTNFNTNINTSDSLFSTMRRLMR